MYTKEWRENHDQKSKEEEGNLSVRRTKKELVPMVHPFTRGKQLATVSLRLLIGFRSVSSAVKSGRWPCRVTRGEWPRLKEGNIGGKNRFDRIFHVVEKGIVL